MTQSKIECMSVLTGLPVEDLEEMFPNEVMAGTAKVRTRKEWSNK